MFDTKPYENKMNLAISHFEDEIKKIRNGRAHPDILSSVKVEVYGTSMPLNQVANITVAEAQMLIVSPFDPANIEAISAAIRQNQILGLNPSDDGRIVRVPVPTLTEERRKLLVKQIAEKVEAARIALRGVRQDAIKDAKKQKDAKAMSEDDLRMVEKEIDRIMAEMQSKIDVIFKAKEKEILTI